MHFRPWVSPWCKRRQITDHCHSDQAQTVARRVEKFAELMQSVWLSKNDYERRVRTVGRITSMGPTLPKESSYTAPPCSFPNAV